MANPLRFLTRAERLKERQRADAPAPPEQGPAAGDTEAPGGVPEPERRPREPGTPPAREAAEGGAAGLYRRALDAVHEFFEAALLEKPLPAAAVKSVAVRIVATLGGDGGELARLAMAPIGSETDYVVRHSVNVAILAVVVGQGLNLERDKLVDLCLTGLIHDVGSVRISPEVLNKRRELTEEEWDEVRRRPSYSRQIIAALGPEYARVAEVAHQIYERLDGSGYPEGLRGRQIPLEAQILGAADMFEGYLHPRPYRAGVPDPLSVVSAQLRQQDVWFSRDVLRALIRRIGLFPVGTYVELNTGEVAEVLRCREGNPMRPLVAVVVDVDGRRLEEPKVIDLVEAPYLYVARPLPLDRVRELEDEG